MSVPSYAARAQRRAAANVATAGQSLTITRLAVTKSDPPTIFTLPGIPQPLAAQEVGQMLVEGGVNALNALPHNFVFAVGADVRENDRIAYNGWNYRIHAVNPTQIAGLQIMVQCAATRDGRAQ